MPRPRAASAVCIDLTSAWPASSILSAATPNSSPRTRKLKKVIAGSTRPSTSSAWVSSGGLCDRANAR